MNNLSIRWLGHACFSLTCDDYHLVLDPYGDGTVPSLPDLQVAANEVLCSHGHRDHCGMDRVMMLLNLLARPGAGRAAGREHHSPDSMRRPARGASGRSGSHSR